MDLPSLVELGSATPQVATFLQAAMQSQQNLLISGATNSGKTSLLRALLSVLSPLERLVVIEIAQELCLWKHPESHANVVELEEQSPDPEGKGGLSMSRLVRRTLRMNPARVIVGEILGEEVTALLNAMSQGNGGSLGTIHGHSSAMAIDRVATYSAQAEHRQDFDVTHAMIAGAVDFIVHLHRDRLTGRRTISEVREITGFDGKRVTSHLIFAAPRPGMPALPAHKISDRRTETLAYYGYDAQANWQAAA
jgi:Flp pilus assembly CpaF family ATPase